MLRRESTRLIAVLLACISGSAQDPFQPAEFAGLTIGKATIEDVKSRFGPPRDEFFDSEGHAWLYYDNVGPFPGKVEIIANWTTRLTDVVTLFPEKISLKEIQARYGSDFKVVRYSFDDCLRVGDSAPIFESKDGRLEYLVYGKLGIAILSDLSFIEYRREPLGPKESQCQAGNAKQKGKKGK